MFDFIAEGLKKGYLSSISTVLSVKNTGAEKDDPFVTKMLGVLTRYAKSNIILVDDKPENQCSQMIDFVVNKVCLKTGIRELDNLKIYRFDPDMFIRNYDNEDLANKHFKNLINELARKDNTFIAIDNLFQMLYDNFTYCGSKVDLTLNMGCFYDAVKKNRIKFIGRVPATDRVLNESGDFIKGKWRDYAEFLKMPEALPQREATSWRVEIDSQLWRLERHHCISIESSAVNTCVSLAEKYIMEGRMPQKAIALLDEAVMRYRVTDGGGKFVLQEGMIKSLVAEKTGIPVNKLSLNRTGHSDCLEELLTSRIIGQEHAVKAIVQAVRTVKAGFKDRKGPDGVFYFLGPSGVGKTEFALTLAELLYGDSSKLMRVDMSELSHPSDITRLIGAAPSFVGYDNGGVLTNWAKKNPASVILLDEFEKAHPKCWDLFLQLFDAGRLTDGHGQSVDFSKTIVIMTSNLGSDCFMERAERGNIGFGINSDQRRAMDMDNIHRNIYGRLASEFRPEFLNRIDEVIMFNPLSVDSLVEIARMMIRKIPVKLIVTDAILRFVAENGYNPQFGARHLKRALKRLILDPVANMVSENTCHKGDIIMVDLCDGRLSFTRERHS